MIALFVDGEEALEDIARFVGHSQTSTTAGYVKRLGHRPKTASKRAAALLDRQPNRDEKETCLDTGHYRGGR